MYARAVVAIPNWKGRSVTSRVPCNVTTFQLERVFTPLDLHSLKTRKIMFCFRVHIPHDDEIRIGVLGVPGIMSVRRPRQRL
jgi:hypothetical protein